MQEFRKSEAIVATIENDTTPPEAVRTTQSSEAEPDQLPVTPDATAAPSSRSKAWIKASTYKSWKRTAGLQSAARWFQASRRPYLSADDRQKIAQGVKSLDLEHQDNTPPNAVYHVDFSSEEVTQLVKQVSLHDHAKMPGTLASLESLCRTLSFPSHKGLVLPKRSPDDIQNFFSDVMSGRASAPDNARVFSLEQDSEMRQQKLRRRSQVNSLLFAREIEGNIGFGRTRQLVNFQNELRKTHEDELDVIAEFTNCAGDIATISWTSDDNFVAGTTAHSDSHNQQYNKPGNLLLCSSAQGTLKAFPDHRIPRPVVEKGENSTEAMRRSQDPWLYSSVVSSDFDQINKRAYTSSFDKTVKVWKVDDDGKSMHVLAKWQHQGNVNFVAAARDSSGRVASAADVPSDAVRVYDVMEEDVANSPFKAFSCSRPTGSDKWEYYPATMQWGRSPGTEHLLVVGYSPRSLTGEDHDIPEEKSNSGEITLWDASQGCRLPVLTATTSNVFEVAWHPTLHRFIVATSPSGLSVDHRVHTQIHLFQRDRERLDGAYSEFQSLDCFASDINELTIMPNSLLHAYVTAACTDGKVYVWDTAQETSPFIF